VPEILLILNGLFAVLENKYKKALEILKSCLIHYPNSEMTFFHIGEIHMHEKEYQGAADSYERCISNSASNDLDSYFSSPVTID